ncbi:hypothetical protein CTAM01_08613 [Colletotrichum tamarilloi]|uniref:Uncharacterized protein n=1 Tax=Colletotrichum tamarilloi TaxID=1209934 RepID=A0ABQ9R5Y2_9PEZI|nr:uncharacterized protein CTAM01_08613 [Colletotrichum tamarilloi]KAK1495484.1 hypothetical protein CTAM01_08613 [Colletotrichum tamarilloi]
MPDSMPTIDQNAQASWDARQDQRLDIELEDYDDPTRGTNALSRRLALMEKMKLLRIPRDDSSGQVPNTRQSPTDNNSKGESSRFGSLSSCNIEDKIEAQLWSLEANRLLDNMEDTESSQSSSKIASIGMVPGGITATSFDQLKSLADRLICALAIYGLNDQDSLAGFESSYKSRDMVIISHSQMVLEDLTSGSKMSRKFNMARRNEPSDSRAEQAMDVSQSELPRFYALIDYITVTLAKIMSFNTEVKAGSRLGSFWHAMILTVLAKLSAKMKILGHNLPGYAVAALRRKRDRIPDVKVRYRWPDKGKMKVYGVDSDSRSSYDSYFDPDSDFETDHADRVELAALPAPDGTIRPEVLSAHTDTYVNAEML